MCALTIVGEISFIFSFVRYGSVRKSLGVFVFLFLVQGCDGGSPEKAQGQKSLKGSFDL
jgi:hypothetical protein